MTEHFVLMRSIERNTGKHIYQKLLMKRINKLILFMGSEARSSFFKQKIRYELSYIWGVCPVEH